MERGNGGGAAGERRRRWRPSLVGRASPHDLPQGFDHACRWQLAFRCPPDMLGRAPDSANLSKPSPCLLAIDLDS